MSKPRRSKATGRWPVSDWVAVLFFALLPFQWIDAFTVAGFEMRLPYTAGLLAAAYAVLSARHRRVLISLLTFAAIWLLPYLGYMLALQIMMPEPQAISILLRQTVFMTIAFAVATLIVGSGAPGQTAKRVGYAFFISLIVGTEAIARSIGLSWTDAVVALMRGDLNFVIYDFFRGIFNANQSGVEGLVPASQKNILGSALVAVLFIFLAGFHPGQRTLAGAAILAIALGCLVIVNSRSLLVVALLALLMSVFIRLRIRTDITVPGSILRILVATVAIAGSIAFISSDSAITQLLGARFSFDDASTAARGMQYAWAIQRIEADFLFGSGYAELDGHPVHNLLLGAFMHGGLLPFLLTFLFYGALVATWINFIVRLMLHPPYWRVPLSAAWVAVLPILPLIRMMIMGDAGHPGLSEWLAMTMFAGFLLLNARPVLFSSPSRNLALAEGAMPR